MNTAWNRWCRNLPSQSVLRPAVNCMHGSNHIGFGVWQCTALSLYDNRITPIVIMDIIGRCNVCVKNPYTCTTSSDPCWGLKWNKVCLWEERMRLSCCTVVLWDYSCPVTLVARNTVIAGWDV